MDRILLLEDDLSLIDGLSFAMHKQGWDVTVARTLAEASERWSDGTYDLLVLDVSLPDGSGFDFCKNVRKVSDVPILFLTASDEETHVVMGLDIGGDDYVTKPFKLGILLSRINALLRRRKGSIVPGLGLGPGSGAGASLGAGTGAGAGAGTGVNIPLESNGITVALTQGKAYKNNRSIELTAAEYRLLCYFMQNPNIVLSKEKIYEHLWDCDSNYVDDNTLSVYIRRLRLKIEDDPEHPAKIVTVRGMGYKWSVSV